MFRSLEHVFRNTISLVFHLVASDSEHEGSDCSASPEAFLRIDWRFCRLRDVEYFADMFPRLVSRHEAVKLNVPLVVLEADGGRGYA